MEKPKFQWYLFPVRKGQEEKVVAEIKKWENYSTYIQDLKMVPEWEGYLLCQCNSVFDVENFFYRLNKNTSLRVGRFLPDPVSPSKVKNLLAKIQTQKKSREPKLSTSLTEFKVGDLVKIKSGVFINQEGRITHLSKSKKKVKIRTESSGAELVNISLTECQKLFD